MAEGEEVGRFFPLPCFASRRFKHITKWQVHANEAQSCCYVSFFCYCSDNGNKVYLLLLVWLLLLALEVVPVLVTPVLLPSAHLFPWLQSISVR